MKLSKKSKTEKKPTAAPTQEAPTPSFDSTSIFEDMKKLAKGGEEMEKVMPTPTPERAAAMKKKEEEKATHEPTPEPTAEPTLAPVDNMTTNVVEVPSEEITEVPTVEATTETPTEDVFDPAKIQDELSEEQSKEIVTTTTPEPKKVRRMTYEEMFGRGWRMG